MRLTILVLMLALPVAAGDARVVVRDPSGAAVAKAEVSLDCGGIVRRANADWKGTVEFGVPDTAACSVKVLADGFQPWEGQYAAGQTEAVNANLAVVVPVTKVEVWPKSAGRRFVHWLTSCTRD